jgi:hypothetical protein
MARCLIGSDSSGLSDPFVRVVFGKHCKMTRVINESISPVWDETLVMDDIDLYGFIDRIVKNPPDIVVEIFDDDLFVSRERMNIVTVRCLL